MRAFGNITVYKTFWNRLRTRVVIFTVCKSASDDSRSIPRYSYNHACKHERIPTKPMILSIVLNGTPCILWASNVIVSRCLYLAAVLSLCYVDVLLTIFHCIVMPREVEQL